MTSGGGLSALALGEIGAGAILAWSGIANASLTSTLHSLLQGKAPATDTGTQPLATVSAQVPLQPEGGAVNSPAPDTAQVAAYKAWIVTLSVAHGWGTAGAQAIEGIIALEDASYDPSICNGPSGDFTATSSQKADGALGIAQALGHGTTSTAGSIGNEYGGYGTTDPIAIAANSGIGTAQIEWMCNYIAQAYGTPQAALAHHLAAGSY